MGKLITCMYKNRSSKASFIYIAALSVLSQKSFVSKMRHFMELSIFLVFYRMIYYPMMNHYIGSSVLGSMSPKLVSITYKYKLVLSSMWIVHYTSRMRYGLFMTCIDPFHWPLVLPACLLISRAIGRSEDNVKKKERRRQ